MKNKNRPIDQRKSIEESIADRKRRDDCDAVSRAVVIEHINAGHPICFSFDTNCFIGAGELVSLSRMRLDRFPSIFQRNMRFLLPKVWEQEIVRHLEVSVLDWHQKCFNGFAERVIGHLGDHELSQAMHTVNSLVRTKKADVEAQRLWSEFKRVFKVEIVPQRAGAAERVLELYAKASAPFEKTGPKKYEFPDAFALDSLSSIADAAAYGIVVVITEDEGCHEYCETVPSLIPFWDFENALEALASPSEQEKIKAGADYLMGEISAGRIDIDEVAGVAVINWLNSEFAMHARRYPELSGWQAYMSFSSFLSFELVREAGSELPLKVLSGWEEGRAVVIRGFFTSRVSVLRHVNASRPRDPGEGPYVIPEPVQLDAELEGTISFGSGVKPRIEITAMSGHEAALLPMPQPPNDWVPVYIA